MSTETSSSSSRRGNEFESKGVPLTVVAKNIESIQDSLGVVFL